ncbi:MAG: amidohydrolase [Chloroflexi bacterium]|nr:amidohydrolase [Chloroflexota bacterium]
MIIDVHAHVFPPLAEASGFARPEEHALFLQLYIATHAQPARRLRDHARSYGNDILGDGRYESPGAFAGADFRVGRCGRFEWIVGGETFYRQFLPPSLQDMQAPAEFLLQEMAYAGVDAAVLQNARLYGRLNTYFAEVARRYPGKFVPLADVDEARADTAEEIARLTSAVTDLGMRGLYYATRGHFIEGYHRHLDDHAFDPYWEEVRRLKIPVFWEILGVPRPTPAAYLEQIARLNRWAERFPDIPCVLTHGIDPDFLRTDLPSTLQELLAREQFLIELLYPIGQGRLYEYPFAETHRTIQRLYARAGGERLVWGSDMPNVLRHCTYQQALQYLQDHCSFIAATDLDRILGGNVARLFNLISRLEGVGEGTRP